MENLYQRLAERAGRWRAEEYPCDDFPAIAEILSWNRLEETGELRFLRAPQLRALETYWYLRLIEKTPHVFDLYQALLPAKTEMLAALGLQHADITKYVPPGAGVEAREPGATEVRDDLHVERYD